MPRQNGGYTTALRAKLTPTRPIRWRITIEGVGHGDAATVKQQVFDAIHDAARAVTGATDLKVTTRRSSPGKGRKAKAKSGGEA